MRNTKLNHPRNGEVSKVCQKSLFVDFSYIHFFSKESETINDELSTTCHTLAVKDEAPKTKREKKAPRNDDVMVN